MSFFDDPFGITRRRREELTSEPFPEDWLGHIEGGVAYWKLLDADEQARLKTHLQILVGEKRFVGAGGLEMTDRIRVVVAAQSAILLLHREHDSYPRLRSVVVCPAGFEAQRRDQAARGNAGSVSGPSCVGNAGSNGSATVVSSRKPLSASVSRMPPRKPPKCTM